jgi:DNA-binding response OmpR family regulator
MTRRILIVEDDLSLQGMYRTALDFRGFEVDVASDGLSALWHIQEKKPDAIVLDLGLPFLRGEAILTELAASSSMRQIPVLVVTGSEPRHVPGWTGAILKKPCDADRLISAISRIFKPKKRMARATPRTPAR